MNETKIQSAAPRNGLRTGRVGMTRVTGLQDTPGGAQFRRRDGERLDLRHQAGSGNRDAKQDVGGVIVRQLLNLAQAPIFIVELPVNHPFKAWRVYGQSKLIIAEGKILYQVGLSNPWVGTYKDVAQTAEIPVNDGDTIYMKISVTLTLEADWDEDDNTTGSPPTHEYAFQLYRVNSASYTTTEVPVPDPPIPGTTILDNYETTFDVWIPICVASVINGQAFVSNQIQRDHVEIHEYIQSRFYYRLLGT